MNNIFLNNDPLLYNINSKQNLLSNQDFNVVPYYKYSNDNNISLYDYIGELNKKMTKLDNKEIIALNENSEYLRLNNELQLEIQKEVISLISSKLNIKQNVIDNIKKQMSIIDSTITSIKKSERDNLEALNDYMSNYSHLTFDEYKRIKNNDKQ